MAGSFLSARLTITIGFVTLTFKGKYYYSGKFDTVAKAAQARWRAEDSLLKPFLEKHAHIMTGKQG